ncbi:MAG: LLM class flavin-dependent oxidoreductase [Azospirillaceae bacterium]|nr:LLM class flavin-dependent oxidoreductase [Azospirillaceae bacterium]
MTLNFHWRLPTDGDSRLKNLDLWNLHTGAETTPGYFPGATSHRQQDRSRFTYFDHLARVAQAAEATGFDGVLVPATPTGEEPFVVAGALIRETRYLRFLPSFHTATTKPVHAARTTATAQRHSGNRLDWNIVAGENDKVQRRWGDFAPVEDRYRRTGDFLDIARGVLTHKDFSHEGAFYQVDHGGLQHPVSAVTPPTVYLSGTSDVALDIAARHADVYTTWAEPLSDLAAKLARLNEAATGHGRRLRHAVRVDVIARASHEEAWEDARHLWETADRTAVRQRQELTGDDIDAAAAERAWAARYANASHFEDSKISPSLWVGEGVVRPGPAVTIVGDYAQVAETLNAYAAIGVDTFILASPPHLEEAYRVGEELLPLFRPTPASLAAE